MPPCPFRRKQVSEEYLGDGLYASFDGFMFTLRAPRSDGDHWVGLEPDVLYAFDQYRDRTLKAARAALADGQDK